MVNFRPIRAEIFIFIKKDGSAKAFEDF